MATPEADLSGFLRDMSPMAEQLSRLERPRVTADDLDKTALLCSHCGHIIPITSEIPFHTGVVAALDPLCEKCRGNSELKNSCRVVCITCKRVVTRVKGGDKCPSTGLVFRPERCYHVIGCGVCRAGDLDPSAPYQSRIVEQEYLAKKLGLKL